MGSWSRRACLAMVLVGWSARLPARPGVVVSGESGRDELVDAAVAPDGRVVVVARQPPPPFVGPDPVLTLALVERDGTQAWRRTWDRGTSVAAWAPDGSVLVATTRDFWSGVDIMRVATADGIGLGRSSRLPRGTALDVVATTDGAEWVATASESTLSTCRFGAMPSLSAWVRSLPAAARGALLAPIDAADVVMAWWDDAAIHVERIGPAGETRWGLAFDRASADIVPGALAWTPRGLVLAGTCAHGDGRATWVAELGGDGSVGHAWTIAIDEATPGRPAIAADGAVGVVARRASGALIAGRLPADRGPALLSEMADVTAPGDPRLVPTPDGRFVVAGSSTAGPGFGETDVRLLELSADDRLPAGCSSSVPCRALVRPALPLGATPETPAWSLVSDALTSGGRGPASPIAGDTLVACGTTACAADDSELASCGNERLDLAAGPARLGFCEDAEDHLTVDTCAGVMHVVTTSLLEPLADTILELWSDDCSTLLASDDDGGGGRASQLAFVAPGDVAHLVVRQKDGTSGPGRAYDLTLARPECPLAWRRLPRSASGADLLHGAAWLADGGVAASGELSIARFDATGEPSWAVAEPARAAAWSLLRPLPDGGILAGGHAVNPASDLVFARVTRLSPGGIPSDELRIETRGRDTFATTVEADGAATFVGGTTFQSQASFSAWLLREAGGAVSWMLVLRRYAWEWAVTPTGDGGAVVANGEWIAQLGPSGERRWERRLGLAAGSPSVIRAARLGEGVILAAWLPEDTGSWSNLGVVGVNATGTMVFERDLGPWRGPSPVATGTFDMVSCSDGGVLLGGHRAGDDGVTVIRLAADGSLLWERKRSPEDADLELACEGQALMPEWPVTGLARLDPAGRVPAGCGLNVLPALPVLPPPGFTLVPDTMPLDAPDLVVTTVPSPFTPSTATSEAACSTEGCPPLSVSIAPPQPDPPCAGAPLTLHAQVTGGAGTSSFEWDLDWMPDAGFDVDAAGGTVLVELASAGPRTIAVRVRDACRWGRQQAFETLVIDVRPGDPPVITGDSIHCAGGACTMLTATGTDPLWSTGETSSAICVAPVASTTYVVEAMGATGCRATSGHRLDVIDCTPPSDVSGPGAMPITLRGATTTEIRFARPANATAVNVLVGLLGDFSSPVAALSSCHVDRWIEEGEGVLRIERALPSDSWIILTASNRAAEGPAGADSFGRERSAGPAWAGCGPTP